jgi:hypothetical protein
VTEEQMRRVAKRAFICGYIICGVENTKEIGPWGLAGEAAFEEWWAQVGKDRCKEAAGA